MATVMTTEQKGRDVQTLNKQKIMRDTERTFECRPVPDHIAELVNKHCRKERNHGKERYVR